MKNFNVSFDYTLNEIPFINIIMYNRTLPDYDIDKDKKGNKNTDKNKLELNKNDWNSFIKAHTSNNRK